MYLMLNFSGILNYEIWSRGVYRMWLNVKRQQKVVGAMYVAARTDIL